MTIMLANTKQLLCVVVARQTQPGSNKPTKTVTTCEEIYLEEKTLIETF